MGYDYKDKIGVLTDYLKGRYQDAQNFEGRKNDRAMELAVGVIYNTISQFTHDEKLKYQHKNHYEQELLINNDDTINRLMTGLTFLADFGYREVAAYHYIDKEFATIVQKRMRYILIRLRTKLAEL